MDKQNMIEKVKEDIYDIQEDIIELEEELQLKQDKLYKLNYSLGLLLEDENQD